ncbi:MAG: GTPase Obg [Chlamydiia bacterium]|nr:GTPase Obg [Chlamydiia bacterium]
MFKDLVTLKLSAGKGGNGAVAWRREKYLPKGGPTGGNGGPGGSIYLESCPDLYSLDMFRNKKFIIAKTGGAGGPNQRNGRKGETLHVKIPCGTIVRDPKTRAIIHDFGHEKEQLLLCEGGKGGLGNAFFKTSRNRAPNRCTPGKDGEEIEIELELKLIADVGFVGFPNAGKSTLLNTLSSTAVKTADYPFTTLRPNLSFIEFDDYSRVYIADIPGIIKGAHENKGLGFSFLKHIERTSVLIYVVDVSTEIRDDPLNDFLTLRKELENYNKDLLDKPFVVALNKIDKDDLALNEFKDKYPYDLETIYPISAATKEGIDTFTKAVKKIAQKDKIRYI